MEERRKFMRFNTSVGVIYKTPEESIKGESISKNFSRKGIGLPVSKRLTPGTLLELKINVPGDDASILAAGEVVWIKKSSDADKKGFDAGIRLTEIRGFDRAKLLDYAYSLWLKSITRENNKK